MKEHFIITYHLGSGKGKVAGILEKLQAFILARGYTYESFDHQFPDDLHRFTSMIIIGGDGTLNYILNQFKEIRIPIGIIMGGTGNDYGMLHLGKASIQEQFETAIQPGFIEVDGGRCNGKYFINGVGIGFDGEVIQSGFGKRFFNGIMAYYTTIIGLLFVYKESPVSIETDHGTWEQDIFMVSVAKGKTFGGGFMVAPHAHPTDGQLDCIATGKINLLNRFRYLPVIEKGKHLHLPFIQFQKTKEVRIKSEKPLLAQVDGELMEAREYVLEVLPAYYRIKSRKYTET